MICAMRCARFIDISIHYCFFYLLWCRSSYNMGAFKCWKAVIIFACSTSNKNFYLLWKRTQWRCITIVLFAWLCSSFYFSNLNRRGLNFKLLSYRGLKGYHLIDINFILLISRNSIFFFLAAVFRRSFNWAFNSCVLANFITSLKIV